MIWWQILLIILGSLMLFTVAFSLICFYAVFVRGPEINFNYKFQFKLSEYRNDKQRMLDAFNWYDNQKFEEVEIVNKDKEKLKGFFLKTEGAEKIAIFFHGWRGSAKNDFSPMFPFYQKLGYNILIVNQRSHGKSQGRIIYFGIKEQFDCLEWIDFVNKTYNPAKIILVGVSMGAATVLLASGHDLPKNVKAVVADCGYSSAEEAIKHLAKHIHSPVYPTVWFAKFWLWVFTGAKLKDGEVKENLKNSKVPTMFIHGTTDKMVACEMTKENLDAKPNNKQVLYIEGAPHAGSYIKDTKLYEETVEKFLQKNVG